MATDDTNKASPDITPLSPRQLIRTLIILAVASSALYTYSDNFSASTKFTFHLLTFASFYGCSIWVSFVAGLVMFKNMPRHSFGRLQSKLFPKYFQFCTITILSSLLLIHNELMTTSMTQFKCLCSILILTLINLCVVEPKTTSIMFKRHVIERKLGTGHEVGQIKPSDPKIANDPDLRAISKKFGMFHGISSTVNLISVCLGTWHLIFIGSKLEMD